MRQTIIIFFFLGISSAAFSQVKDTIYVQGDTIIPKRDTAIRNILLTVNYKNYIGKTVDDLLNNDTVKLYKSLWWSDEPPRKLSSLNLTYASGLYIRIYAYHLKYQPRYSKTREFNLDLFRKEKISNIKLDRWFFDLNLIR